MAIAGIFASDSGPHHARARVTDDLPHAMLAAGEAPASPFYALTAGMASKSISDVVVSWQESQEMDYTSYVTSNCGDPCGTQLEVSNPEMLDCKTMLYHACSGEIVMVMSISGNKIHVRRGFGCTGKTHINKGDALERLTTAFEEGSTPPQGFVGAHTGVTNHTSIIRSTYDMTGTAMAQDYSMGDLDNWMNQQTSRRHARDKEMALFFMRRASGVINKKPFRTLAGIDEQIKQNRAICPPCGLDRHLLNAWLDRIYSQNIKDQPNERIFFGSPVALTALHELGWGHTTKEVSFVNPVTKGVSIGLVFREYITPSGHSMKLFTSPFMTGQAWGSRLYAIHPGSVKMFHMQNRQNIRQSEGDGSNQNTNGSATGLRDARMVVFTSEFTVALQQQSVSGMMDCIVPAFATN